jgi:hypothetical protein
MLDKHSGSSRPQPAEMQVKKMKISQELVTAIAERVYRMLIRELKVEREHQRYLNGTHRR